MGKNIILKMVAFFSRLSMFSDYQYNTTAHTRENLEARINTLLTQHDTSLNANSWTFCKLSKCSDSESGISSRRRDLGILNSFGIRCRVLSPRLDFYFLNFQ